MEQALHPAYLPEGTRIGPWRLLHPLGRGAFGTVYRVEGVEPDASGPAALKLAHAPNDERFARSAGGVHRDVKGANILVRTRDARSFLVDFGSCHYQGASPLTWHPFPPGTLAYRPPEAFAHSLQLLKAGGPLLTYSARPADDVFALGVTAWRLVTGSYPPSPQPLDAQAHVWAPNGPGPQPAHELNAYCSVELSRLISRMLSVWPEARGTAGELAEALEWAARRAGPAADVSLFNQEPPQVGASQESYLPLESRGAHRSGRSPLMAVSLSAALAFAALWVATRYGGGASTTGQAMADGEESDGGTVGLGDAVPTAQQAAPHGPSVWFAIGVDLPSRPFPSQARPDSKGRCPYELLVPINGGCWLPVGEDANNCPPHSFAYKGRCYAPFLRLPSPPTSSPSDAP